MVFCKKILYMPQSIIDAARQYVLDLLANKLDPQLRYHNLAHTVSVRNAALQLARVAGLDEQACEWLELAAWFHDTGFVEATEGHEEVSKRIARQFLEAHGYPEEGIRQVERLIDVTRLDEKPITRLEQLMKDADLNNLAGPNYLYTLDNLRHERRVFYGEEYSDIEWLASNVAFLENHKYYSPEAQIAFGAGKQDNIDMVKRLLARHIAKKEKKKQKKSKKQRAGLLDNSASGRMIFKTALRNHIDLTSIADNKANIMLSINALIITIAMPLLAAYLRAHPSLTIPALLLLVTCLVSIIFATLVTRPIRTTGRISVPPAEGQPANLFFFGNFYQMSFEEYKLGLRKLLADHKMLDEAIMADLFFLGKALGRKFWLLRICYMVFMVGITLTVVAFALTYLIA